MNARRETVDDHIYDNISHLRRYYAFAAFQGYFTVGITGHTPVAIREWHMTAAAIGRHRILRHVIISLNIGYQFHCH
jgi:hypothetical protein